jgi:hypothetical protein
VLGHFLSLWDEYLIVGEFKGWISHAGCIGLEEGTFVSKEVALE